MALRMVCYAPIIRIVEVERETEDGRHEPILLLDFNVEGNIWEKM